MEEGRKWPPPVSTTTKVPFDPPASSYALVQSTIIIWTVAYQASRSMGFSRQEYWSGLPFPSPGDLPPDPGIEPRSPAL